MVSSIPIYRSIWPINETLTGTQTMDQSGFESNGNKFDSTLKVEWIKGLAIFFFTRNPRTLSDHSW